MRLESLKMWLLSKMKSWDVNFLILPQCDPIVCTVLCIDETKIIWYFFVDLRLPFLKYWCTSMRHFIIKRTFFVQCWQGKFIFLQNLSRALRVIDAFPLEKVAVCFLILCVVMQNRIFFCTEKWEERVWRKCYPSTRKFGCGPFDVKKRARVFLH